MSVTKRQFNERQKMKKMSKAQMQLAIIKKKQCDAKALAIVEQLLESSVNSEWLLQNLKFISKSHMEDVIEERAIIKLCGYVLCSKPLTVIIRQQYHISIHKNKVYDISRRKNFCSLLCFGAANYLLEQMLESPLWLREIDDIPIFQVLPIDPNSKQCIPGDEINISENLKSQNVNTDNIDNKESTEHSTSQQAKEDSTSQQAKEDSTSQQAKEDISLNLEKKNVHSSYLSNNIINDDIVKIEEIPVNINLQKFESPSDLYMNQEKRDHDHCEESIDCKSNYTNIHKINLDSENLEIKVAEQSANILHLHEYNRIDAQNKNVYVACTSNDSKTLQFELDEIMNENNCNKMLQPLNEISNDMKDVNKTLQFQSSEISNENNEKLQPQLDKTNSNNGGRKIMQPQLDEISNTNTTISSKSYTEPRNKKNTEKINKKKKHKHNESDNAEAQTNIYHKLVMHVEQSVKEWVTESTLCLLTGEMDEKRQLLENLTQQDKYQQLCKKLNRLQLEDEKEERANLERDELKPLPHFSVLQEEGEKINLKVRAFYKGQMTITSSEDDDKESKSKDDGDSVLPLMDAHAPNALRRRIFLDKLNKILPDLMRALTSNVNSSMAQCTYDHEKYLLIKILISTFNLSATNIIFKTAEWTLVGLIVIKMLSLIDVQLQSLLQSKQSSMYTSMILTTYKLDSSYLNRFIMEVTNTVNTSK